MGPFVLALEFSEVTGTVFAGKQGGHGGAGRGGPGSLGSLILDTPSPGSPAPHQLPLRKRPRPPPWTLWRCLVQGSAVYSLLRRGSWRASCQAQRAAPPLPHLGHPAGPPPACSLPPALCLLDPVSGLVVGKSKVPVYAHARCWLEEEEGTGSREQGGGNPGLFRSQAPRFPLFQEGASSLPPSCLSAAAAPLSPRGARVKSGPSGADCCTVEGVRGVPTTHSLCPAPLNTHTHTAILQTKEKPVQSGVHGQPSQPQLGGKDEVAVAGRV